MRTREHTPLCFYTIFTFQSLSPPHFAKDLIRASIRSEAGPQHVVIDI
jgi:hypothetical protein